MMLAQPLPSSAGRGHVALLVALLVALCPVAAMAGELPARFDPGRDAAADVAHAVALANGEGRRVIVDVGGEWCPWCHILDRFIAAHPGVSARIQAHFVWVKVNFSKENRNEALLSRWPKIEGYPHLFVLDANGALLHSEDTSKLEAGRSYDPAKVAAFLDRWSIGH
ncbi:MAG TPA: thioredoxin family protein [Casimicrobiaceae bacterium]|nr:thioredoxin family protein [Casimicrobiaceae bacterium]